MPTNVGKLAVASDYPLMDLSDLQFPAHDAVVARRGSG
jgi:hypothetical protein